MVKALENGIIVREFKLQSRYFFNFWTNTFGKSMNPLILRERGCIVLQLFSYKDGFGIK